MTSTGRRYLAARRACGDSLFGASHELHESSSAQALPSGRERHATASATRLRWALLATVGMAAAFAAIAGWRGALLFGLLAVGVAFGVQIITYIQHWALGQDSLGNAVGYGRGWEDDCQFQAWITLNISLHDVHHREARLPYYRLQLSPDSPRLPAGYVMLMFASLLPPVWRRAMEPALARWFESPAEPMSAGRRLTCFGLPSR